MAKSRTATLSKEAFLNQNTLRKELCPIPELGGSVWVRELSGKALLDYRERVQKLQDEAGADAEVTPAQSLDLMALLVSLTVVDDDGRLMFTEEEAYQLVYGSVAVLERLSSKAMELSGISKRVADEVTDSLKNAATLPSTAS
jgi:hypothetical protein